MASILVVDDSSTQLHAYKSMLEKNGHQVSVARNGEEGLQLAEQQHPDIILMDIVMPGGMDGFQTTRKLRSLPQTKNIPIIIVSSKDQDIDKIWGKRQGACEYLCKPVSEAELLATMQRCEQQSKPA